MLEPSAQHLCDIANLQAPISLAKGELALGEKLFFNDRADNLELQQLGCDVFLTEGSKYLYFIRNVTLHNCYSEAICDKI